MYAPATPQEDNVLAAPENLSNVGLIRQIKRTKHTIETTDSEFVEAMSSMYLQELYDEAASRRVHTR